jgi:hypothetical protein
VGHILLVINSTGKKITRFLVFSFFFNIFTFFLINVDLFVFCFFALVVICFSSMGSLYIF